MPRGSTETRPMFGGAQILVTYDNQGDITGYTIFLPNGLTGRVEATDVSTSQVYGQDYQAPVPGHPEFVVTLGGTVTTINGLLGMQWTQSIPGKIHTNSGDYSFGYSAGNTLPQ